MKNIYKLILGISLCLSPAAWAGGDFVGNSGDGVRIGTQVYLRDLLELGIQNSAWIGTKRNSRFSKNLDYLPVSLGATRELVARKLADIDGVDPGLADYLRAAMQSYTFFFVPFPLVKDPQEWPDLGYSEADRVQLATREFTTVYISSPAWAQMDQENRAALILHEMLGSLARPVRAQNRSERQPTELIREITGPLFTPSVNRSGKAVLFYPPSEILDVPDEDFAAGPNLFRWTLSLEDEHGGAVKSSSSFDSYDKYEEVRERALALCDSLAEAKKMGTPMRLRSVIQTRAWNPVFIDYDGSNGPERRLTIVPHPASELLDQIETTQPDTACLCLVGIALDKLFQGI